MKFQGNNREVVFTALVLVLLALVAFQYADNRNLRTALYEQCEDRADYDQRASEARAAFAERDRALVEADTELMSRAPETDIFQKRIDAYTSAIEAVRLANDAVLPSSYCQTYKPIAGGPP